MPLLLLQTIPTYSSGFQLSHAAKRSGTEVHKPTSRYPKKTKIILYLHGSVHRESVSIIVQQDATIYSFIIFLRTALCVSDDPSSGANAICNYSIWHWSNCICYRPLTWRSRNVLLMMDEGIIRNT